MRELSGNISGTATHFGVARNSMYRFIERHNLQSVLDESRESLVDIAETALKRAVVGGEAWAVCFTLKTQGKRRGYVERIEQTGANGEAQKLVIEVVRRDDANGSTGAAEPAPETSGN